MAIPTAPTANSIVVNALDQIGISSPEPNEITKGTDVWLERVKNKIQRKVLQQRNTRLAILQQTAILIGTLGERRISVPPDFNEEISIELLDGTHTDTAQSGGANTAKLASDEDLTEVEAVGNYYLGLTGDSHKGQYRQMNAYNTTTKVATVEANWDSGSTPISTDTYLIAKDQHKINKQSQDELDQNVTTAPTARPSLFSKYKKELYFNKALDKATYGIKLRYYSDLNKIDLDSELMRDIYSDWQTLLEQGVSMMALQRNDDDQFRTAKALFDGTLADVILEGIPYGGSFTGFEIG